MDQQMNSVTFPSGGSLRITGTMYRNSAEFQALAGNTGEQQSASQQATRRCRAEGAWHAMRGLWE